MSFFVEGTMELKEFFEVNPEVAIAFSGGVDSAYLLYAANKWAKRVCAYYVKSAFQPQFELDDAIRLATELNATMRILNVNVLADQEVCKNPSGRCYFCKKAIFGNIIKAAAEDGFTVLLDGTNASDDAGDRPGMKALAEMHVKSPLRQCGLTKDEIRKLSKEAGLFTWDKPSYACLATRIATGEVITEDKLKATEAAEDYLFGLGFSDFRVRMRGSEARIQLKEDQMELLLKNRQQILDELKKYYSAVTLDLNSR